jgi:hypothetical protein
VLSYVSAGVYQLRKEYGVDAAGLSIGRPARVIYKPVTGYDDRRQEWHAAQLRRHGRYHHRPRHHLPRAESPGRRDHRRL